MQKEIVLEEHLALITIRIKVKCSSTFLRGKYTLAPCQTTRNDTGKVFLTVSYDHIHIVFGFLVVETGGQALPSLQQNIYNLTMLKAFQFQMDLILTSIFQRTKMMRMT